MNSVGFVSHNFVQVGRVMELYGVNTKCSISEETVHRALSLLGVDQQQRIYRFRRWSDRLNALTGQMLAVGHVSNHLGLPARSVQLSTNGHGKPLVKHAMELDFNVSHSGHWVLFASDRQDIGIDVEWVRPVDVCHIGPRILSRREWNALYRCEPSNRISLFYEIWTLKESYVKAKGVGLSMQFNGFDVCEDGGTLRDIIEDTNGQIYTFGRYEIDDGYRAAVCAKSGRLAEGIKLISLRDTFEMFFDQMRR